MMVCKARKIVLDTVCGTEVDPTKTEYVFEHKGEKYYFCDKECMASFQKNPERFIDMKRALEATCGVL